MSIVSPATHTIAIRRVRWSYADIRWHLLTFVHILGPKHYSYATHRFNTLSIRYVYSQFCISKGFIKYIFFIHNSYVFLIHNSVTEPLGGAGPNWEQFRSAQVPSQLAPRSVELGAGPKWEQYVQLA